MNHFESNNFGIVRYVGIIAAFCVVLIALGAHAQDAANGKILYSTPQVAGGMSCSNSQCHGVSPANRQNGIQNGANSPVTIWAAMNNVNRMAFLRAAFTGASDSKLANLAAYIANPNVAVSSPSAQLAVASLAFPDTGVGAIAPGQAVALTNTGNAALVLGAANPSNTDFAIAGSTCSAGVSLAPGAHCTLLITFTPSTVGARAGSISIAHNANPAQSTISVTGAAIAASATLPPTRQMVEYLYKPLQYYFVTSRDADKLALDAIADFQRTGASFLVYTAQQGAMRGITRFYFDKVAKAGTRGSHFYTLFDSDLLLLADQNPKRAQSPSLAQNEGIDSFAFLPQGAGAGATCASGSAPVYRLFRGNTRFPDDPNHRFTTSLTVYNEFVAAGWDGEGINFCVPTQ